jgi:N utilization substance protein B
MEANGKSYRTIKNELKETFYMGQIQGLEIFKPNYLLSQKIIEQATKNQIKIDTKINMAFNNLWNIKTIDTTLRAILRAASAETLNKKTPKKVILSEYISITGTFYPSGQEQKLVNGLLNKIIEDLQI